jgi:hypothetical protein
VGVVLEEGNEGREQKEKIMRERERKEGNG